MRLLPFYIARRLSLSREGTRNAPAVAVATTAVALSVAIMLASLAIVKGFKKQVRDRVVGFNSHITVYPAQLTTDDDNILTLTPEFKSFMDSIPFVESYGLSASIPAILKTRDDFKGIYLKGASDAETERFIASNLESGKSFDFSGSANSNKIIISSTAAKELRLHVGDKIDTYFISDELRVRRLEVTGIYNTHFSQYDDVLAFGALPLIQKIGGLESNQGTFLQVATDDFNRIEEYTVCLQNMFNKSFTTGSTDRFCQTQNALSQGAAYFNWLELLDMNVVVVIVLMIVVGCVTLISGMLMLMLEKKRFIGIVKTLGASNGLVRGIFICLALRIALWGLAAGNSIALIILWIQKKTHAIPLDADSYYIDYVPVDISVTDVLWLNIGVVVVMYASLVLPSRLASGISPADILRGEE